MLLLVLVSEGRYQMTCSILSVVLEKKKVMLEQRFDILIYHAQGRRLIGMTRRKHFHGPYTTPLLLALSQLAFVMIGV
jgi:hypothetical protein